MLIVLSNILIYSNHWNFYLFIIIWEIIIKSMVLAVYRAANGTFILQYVFMLISFRLFKPILRNEIISMLHTMFWPLLWMDVGLCLNCYCSLTCSLALTYHLVIQLFSIVNSQSLPLNREKAKSIHYICDKITYLRQECKWTLL